MSSPADIIYQFLLDEGLGSVDDSGWQLYVGHLPSIAPDSAIVIYDQAGKNDGRVMSGPIPGEMIRHPGIQVLVRGMVYPEVYAKAEAIALAFDQQANTLVEIASDESYTLRNISRTGDILNIGMDPEGDRRRHNFSVNAVLTVDRNQ